MKVWWKYNVSNTKISKETIKPDNYNIESHLAYKHIKCVYWLDTQSKKFGGDTTLQTWVFFNYV